LKHLKTPFFDPHPLNPHPLNPHPLNPHPINPIKPLHPHQAKQEPNEFIVLNAAAYHAGYNMGFNCAEVRREGRCFSLRL